MRLGHLALACGALLVPAGCGGDDGKGGESPARPPGEVVMREIAFHPKTSSVMLGRRVRWRNEDSVDHNVVATAGARFRSRAFGKGGSFSVRPQRAGRIDYVCTLHPGMRAALIVKR